MIQVPESDYPTELALIVTDLSLQCGQFWTALATTLLFTRTIASVSVRLPPWLSVGYRTLWIKTLGRWQSTAYMVYIWTP